MDSRNCIHWVHFYTYQISFERLIGALNSIAEKYPILCGRIRSNEATGIHVEVQRSKGFNISHMKSDLSLFEAISKAHVTDQVAEFPSIAELPFFMADLNCCALFNEDASLFSVKLVHYKDNSCSLASAIRHNISDGKRFVDLHVDLARAYCNQSLREVDHHRSRLWPDVFLQNIDIGLSPHDFSRRINFSVQAKAMSIPGETYSVESIYFPNGDIEELKGKAMKELEKEGKYVSRVDVITAVMWMLLCELNSIKTGENRSFKTSLDLEIPGTYFLLVIDLASDNTKFLPMNYFGNGHLVAFVQYPECQVHNQKPFDLLGTAIEASKAIRKEILTSRSSSVIAKKLMGLYKGEGHPAKSLPFVGVMSSFYKMPIDQIDFQGGAPVHSYLPPTYPFSLNRGSLYSTGGRTGMILSMVLLKRDRQNAINSTVLRELCPNACFVTEMTTAELSKCCLGTK